MAVQCCTYLVMSLASRNMRSPSLRLSLSHWPWVGRPADVEEGIDVVELPQLALAGAFACPEQRDISTTTSE